MLTCYANAIPQEAIRVIYFPALVYPFPAYCVGSVKVVSTVLIQDAFPIPFEWLPFVIYAGHNSKRYHIVNTAIGLIAAIEETL